MIIIDLIQRRRDAGDFAVITLAKAAAAALALLATAAGAAAQGRPALVRFSCADAKALVAQRGEVIFDTGPHTFLGFVRDANFCPRGDTTEPLFAATKDNPQCFVGYGCRPFEKDRLFRR